MTVNFHLGLRSQANLLGVHEDLCTVVRLAIKLSPVDFTVTEGRRTLERQSELLAANSSKTLNSRHITGHAVDVAAIVGGKVTWEWQRYEEIALAFKAAAKELDIAIDWGGDWPKFRDGPHFQLSRKEYPA